MKNLLVAGLYMLSSMMMAQPVTLEWAKGVGGSGVDWGQSISVDKNGFIYTAGLFSGTVDFDKGPGVANLTSNGGTDVFVQKLDSQGNLIWAKSFGGSNSDYCYSVSTDSSGNVSITGRFKGIVDFDPGAGTYNLISTQFRTNTFIVKLNSSGNLVWAKSFKGDQGNDAFYHASDDHGNLYIAGRFSGTVDLDPGANILNFTASGSEDGYLVKLSASGSLLWANTFGGQGSVGSRSLAIDKNGNCYISGIISGPVSFDTSSTNFDLTSKGGFDVFVAAFSNSGSIKWAHSFGSSADDWGMSMALDKNGNVFTTGSFHGSPDFDPGPGSFLMHSGGSQHIFLQKLDSLGNFVWAKSIGSSTTFLSHQGTSVVTDKHGNVFFAGKYAETIDLDPGPEVFNRTAIGTVFRTDFFIVKLDSLGDFLWGRSFGTDGTEENIYMATDNTDNLYLTGHHSKSIDFDPTSSTLFIDHVNYEDVFVVKLKQCNADVAVTVNDPSITARASNAGYQWLDCNNQYIAIPGATNRTFIPTANGRYALQVDDQGCIDTSKCVEISTVGMDEFSLLATTIFPNPGSGDFKVQFGSQKYVILSVYDISGKLVIDEMRLTPDHPGFELKAKPGLYVVEIRSQEHDFRQILIRK